MASQKELKALITLAGSVDPSLQKAMLKATGEMNSINTATKKATKSTLSFGDAWKASFIGNTAANAVSYAVSKIKELSSEGIELASSLNEVQNVVDVTFGQNAKVIDEFAKSALEAYGLSELQVKQYSGTMGAMLKSSGVAENDLLIMSQNLAGLSGDLASFYNLDHDTAFEKIRSGISGETEPLKQLGINMSVANMEAFALSKGINKSYSSMTQAEQSLLRYNYLMEVSADAQGDFARTIDGYANQQRLFSTNIKQTAAAVGQELLPYLTAFYQEGNEIIKNLDIQKWAEGIGEGLKTVASVTGFLIDNFDLLISVGGGFVAMMATMTIINKVKMAMDLWKASTFGVAVAQKGLNAALLANPMGLVIVGIGLLVAAGIYMYRKWDDITAGVSGFIGGMQDKLVGFVDKVKSIKPPDWVMKIVDKASSINSAIGNFVTGGKSSSLQQFASGGIATQASIFGEAGPEMAIPLQRTSRSIGLLNKTADILGVNKTIVTGGNGGNTFKFEINADGGSVGVAEDIKGKIVEILEEFFPNDDARVTYA